MPKFLIIHNATEPTRDFMSKFTQVQMQEGMEEWDRWKTQVEKDYKIKFEYGMPLQAVAQVTPQGEKTSTNKASGYSIITADSKIIVVEALKNHPHMQRDGASMDILEMVDMTGL